VAQIAQGLGLATRCARDDVRRHRALMAQVQTWSSPTAREPQTADTEKLCRVDVIAFDICSKRWVKSYDIPATQALRLLREQWANNFQKPAEVVGFEDAKERLLDLQLSPRELGWGAKACVQAVPLDAHWAGAEEPRSKAGKGSCQSREAGTKRQAEREAERPGTSRSSGGSRDTGKRRQTVAAAPVTQEDVKDVSEAAPLPHDDEAITFEQTNPKRPGTAAHTRYEKYKKAKTPKEAMQVGAQRCDIVHDFGKGFLRRV